MTSKDWNRDGARRREWRAVRDEDLARTLALDAGPGWDPSFAETVTAPRRAGFDGAHYGRYHVAAATADFEEPRAATVPSARKPGHVGRRVLFAAAGLALVGGAGCTAARKLSSQSSGYSGAAGGSGPATVPSQSQSQSQGQAASSSTTPSASSAAPSDSATPSGSPTDLSSSSASNPVSAPPDTAGPSNTANPGQVRTQPQYYVEAGPKMIALTLDDGPTNEYTPQVLALLDQYHIKATFCMIGSQIAANRSLVREVAEAGHVIVNHTWDHANLSKMSSAGVRSEISRTNDALAAVGVHPSVFRAPYGAWSATVFESCADAGLRPLDWSVDPEDWSRPGTSVIVSRIMRNTRTGSIILEHDGGGDRSQTVAALKIVLPQLLEAGYRFTSV